jgi:hypothetical protein
MPADTPPTTVTERDVQLEEAWAAYENGLGHLLPRGHPGRPPLRLRLRLRWNAFLRRALRRMETRRGQ